MSNLGSKLYLLTAQSPIFVLLSRLQHTNQRPSLGGGNEGLSYGVGWIRWPESGDLEAEMKCDVVDVDGFGSVSALMLW
jgi:hypothetical protein